MGCVEDLAGLVGVECAMREEFDWGAIESSLGMPLPGDYKDLVERLPDGRFQGFVRVIRPGDSGHPRSIYLGYYEHRLEDMRRWRADDPGRFPYPIYPEPGGLLPWGVSSRAGLCFWLTEALDPGAWPVVLAHPEFTNWTAPYVGTVCEFLRGVVSGTFDARPVGIELPPDRRPSFEPRPRERETAAPRTDRNFFSVRQAQFGGEPINRFDELVRRLGASGHPTEQIDWMRAEQHIGLPLPSDYKAFIDAYGAGTFCDIAIAAPATTEEMDLLSLITRTHQRATGSPIRLRGMAPPVHPEPGGMIPWGHIPEGWTCCWAPTGHDPDRWGIVLADDGMRPVEYKPSTSFSSLLVQYATPGAPPVFEFLGKPNPGNCSYTRCHT